MATVNVILPAEQGDALNYLDGNAMSKGDIINVLQRMGGVANRLDFRKAAALGSTFLSLGAAPEIAASASNAMVREISIATMQSKRFFDGMDLLKLNPAEIEKQRPPTQWALSSAFWRRSTSYPKISACLP